MWKNLTWMVVLCCNMTMSSILPVISNNASHLHFYYVVMPIGSPPQQIPLMIDTSSSHTYLQSPQRDNGYRASMSSTFSWLTCLDHIHCNTCLDNHKQCGWKFFVSEQVYVMAKDVIHLTDDDDDSNSGSDSDSGSSSDSGSREA